MAFFIAYGFFTVFIYLYLFQFHSSAAVPPEQAGTATDPQTFLTVDELILSEQYSNIRNFLFFLEIPYEWLFYLLILLSGSGKIFESWAQRTAKKRLLQSAVYAFCLSFCSLIFFFPVKYAGYRISKYYGLSNETFHSWMRDRMIDFWLNWLFLFIVVAAVYLLMRKSEKRWWFYAWCVSVPFTLFVMFIRPVLIDPLYNDFYPLKNKVLEEKILSLAEEAGIPAEHVYEVNMSEKTNTLNAYVTGIGSNSRIVLWDTTLKQLEEDEILFIMAHEMAHYLEKHIFIGITGYLLMSFIGLWITARLLNMFFDKLKDVFHMTGKTAFSSFPLILLILSMLSFAASPLTNAVSRHLEKRADTYAVELTRDADAGISTFHELARAGLSQVNPPLLVKWFRYGHPTIKERIEMLENYAKENTHHNE